MPGEKSTYAKSTYVCYFHWCFHSVLFFFPHTFLWYWPFKTFTYSFNLCPCSHSLILSRYPDCLLHIENRSHRFNFSHVVSSPTLLPLSPSFQILLLFQGKRCWPHALSGEGPSHGYSWPYQVLPALEFYPRMSQIQMHSVCSHPPSLCSLWYVPHATWHVLAWSWQIPKQLFLATHFTRVGSPHAPQSSPAEGTGVSGVVGS